jgi:hypothetical protein
MAADTQDGLFGPNPPSGLATKWDSHRGSLAKKVIGWVIGWSFQVVVKPPSSILNFKSPNE